MNSISQFPQRQNPDAYAKIYAQQNNLSFEDAKTALREKYGEPQQDTSIFSYNNLNNDKFDSFSLSNNGFEEIDTQEKSFFQTILDLFNFSKNNNSEQNDPDTIAKNFAAEHNISLEEAKEQLRELYGDPEQK